MSFPPPPDSTVDCVNLGFKIQEVNGHVECRYSAQSGTWSPPKFVRDPYLRLHGMAPGLNYGQQAFEGLKAYRTPANRITVFRVDRNAARLAHSSSFISVPEVPEALFIECVRVAVALNAAYVPSSDTGGSLYLRPLIFGSSPQLGLSPPDEYLFCVYAIPVGVYHGVQPLKALILDDFDRAAPHGTGSAKLGGNYGPVLRWSEQARNEGYGITLHLDSSTHSEIDEFSTSGFIGVLKDTESDVITLVVPNSKNVISSITSESVVAIAQSFGWKTESRSIKYEELASFSEVIAAGTAAALVPIRSITRKSKNQTFTYIPDDLSSPGKVYTHLLETLKAIQYGLVEDKFGWNTVVDQVNPRQYIQDEDQINS
ncbi:BgTH12-00050 [Blumeria graminis f. sp. triticale]|uniref:BgTH12-00050 n=1 Tax=Blumeria graminis f. sp. triticale TaxID=1689686 RepID=A0A9W4D5M4_BLUGR|nr:BgTH12-00050 [Blumeria graminis f. sp. triticale]